MLAKATVAATAPQGVSRDNGRAGLKFAGGKE
jgi:hypothetical protein